MNRDLNEASIFTGVKARRLPISILKHLYHRIHCRLSSWRTGEDFSERIWFTEARGIRKD